MLGLKPVLSGLKPFLSTDILILFLAYISRATALSKSTLMSSKIKDFLCSLDYIFSPSLSGVGGGVVVVTVYF